ARLAVYGPATEPPEMAEVAEADPGVLVERLYEGAAARAHTPCIALREIIENLVHADFRDALVSVLDGGHTVRVSDSGPGIPDPARALMPGFTTAGQRERRVVRGAGCGLPLAARVLADAGGDLDVGQNLGGGAVVTLRVPLPEDSAGVVGDDGPGLPGEDARLVMALLLEMGPSRPERIAGELGWPVGRCGRELVLLESRGLVARDGDGTRALTGAGSTLLATLF
ncbi:MAG TPA: ATP-binding protein, partial [Miltoncostaeaceae bacterium]|nr:ATP-binding protein [Miltoncostaeaceae bacterium]